MKPWLPALLAVLGGVALGLPFADGGAGPVELVPGLCCVGVAVGAAIQHQLGPWRIGSLAFGCFAVAAIGGAVGLQAWEDRVRRDTSQDERYVREGVVVQARPSTSVLVGDGPAEYCAVMFVDVYGTDFEQETVDGKLLTTERCDLTRSLYEEAWQAERDFRDVQVLVLPELVTDSYGRPRLDGYRFPEEVEGEDLTAGSRGAPGGRR